ncbi:MAG: hypothetical protein IPO21_11895 [Bacteroidales bacterium]|nr:hypothetical protein [Bacteroidales bacterium]
MITSANMEKKQIHVKKVIAVFSIFMLISAMLFAQKPVFIPKSQNQEPYYKNKWYFGISLLTSYGGFVNYGFIKIHEDGLEEITSLTEANWVRQATGQQPSKANPDQVNLFEKYQVKWETFDLLWKLRYSEYPYEGENKWKLVGLGKCFAHQTINRNS